MINFRFRNGGSEHVCELQLVHRSMLTARKGLPGHDVYNRVRNAWELLEHVGIDMQRWWLQCFGFSHNCLVKGRLKLGNHQLSKKMMMKSKTNNPMTKLLHWLIGEPESTPWQPTVELHGGLIRGTSMSAAMQTYMQFEQSVQSVQSGFYLICIMN